MSKAIKREVATPDYIEYNNPYVAIPTYDIKPFNFAEFLKSDSVTRDLRRSIMTDNGVTLNSLNNNTNIDEFVPIQSNDVASTTPSLPANKLEGINSVNKPSKKKAPKTGIERFRCSMCTSSFKYKYGLNEHFKAKHSENTPSFACTLCPKTFATNYSLHRHVTARHMPDKVIRCKKANCDKIFATECERKRHVEEAHLQFLRKFSCPSCDKKFTRISNLNRHMKLHNNIREFSCSLCSRDFTQRVHRDKHMMIHFRKSNQCPKCETVYTKLKYFNNHVTNVCFAINPKPLHSAVMCPLCKHGVRDLSRLRSHLNNVHNVDGKCPNCQKEYQEIGELVTHIKECQKENTGLLEDFANSLMDTFHR